MFQCVDVSVCRHFAGLSTFRCVDVLTSYLQKGPLKHMKAWLVTKMVIILQTIYPNGFLQWFFYNFAIQEFYFLNMFFHFTLHRSDIINIFPTFKYVTANFSPLMPRIKYRTCAPWVADIDLPQSNCGGFFASCNNKYKVCFNIKAQGHRRFLGCLAVEIQIGKSRLITCVAMVMPWRLFMLQNNVGHPLRLKPYIYIQNIKHSCKFVDLRHLCFRDSLLCVFICT